MKISKKDEMIKFIYLNILYWVNISEFKKLFWVNIFKAFISEFKFLNVHKVVYVENNVLYSQKSDLDTLVYFGIFFLEQIRGISFSDGDDIKFKDFFLDDGEMIDK